MTLFPTEPPGSPQPREEPAAERGPFCDVALNRPMRCEFTYSVPADAVDRVAPGVRVAVPFHGRREVGVVVRVSDETELAAKRVRPLASVLDAQPILGEELLELTRWIASYYACSWGEALAAVLPGALKRERGRRTVAYVSVAEGVGDDELAEIEERHPKQHRLLRTLVAAGGPVERAEILRKTQLSRSPLQTLVRRGWVIVRQRESSPDELTSAQAGERVRPEKLTEEQDHAVGRLRETLDARDYSTFLLYGVTGSGKTEVYLRVIEHALAQGRGAIVLVPEIALTPQTVGWFRSRFGDIGVLHSRMTDLQRTQMWERVRRGECRVVVGARSAIFAPIEDLGVIVVDEEHEPSFKQGSVPRYHGRDVAVMRAKNAGAVCILGSATPSLESWANVDRGRYELLQLRSRVRGNPMPSIHVVDMRKEMAETKMPALFSRDLHRRLEETLRRKEQAILFLNRRGYAPVLWCRSCGETVKCENCDVSMAFHKRLGRLVCHTCCEEIRPPDACPSCTAPGLRFLGMGSERVEDVLQKLFPEARVGRMDSDTMLRREDYEERLAEFGRGELDVLVGTQMIAKGLDFPRVTLVGIVSADSALHLPDFRSGERTFQLISQVSGRAGRGALPGEIVIQTITPEHPAVSLAARHDFEAFARWDNALRAELGYPPHGKLIRVVFEDEDERRAREFSERVAHVLGDVLTEHGVMVLGPMPAPLAMVRGRHRSHLLVKGKEEGTGLARARALLIELSNESGRTRVAIDVDPVSML